MGNLFKKIGILTLGLSMALGVGISVASFQGGRVQETNAAEVLSYSLTFQDSGKSADGSTALTTSTAISSVISDNPTKVSAISATSNTFLGKSGYGLKFSSKSSAGSIAFTLANTIKVTKIVATACLFGTDGASFKINDIAQGSDLTSSLAAVNFEYATATEISSIAIAATKASKCRFYVQKLDLYVVNSTDPTISLSNSSVNSYVGADPISLSVSSVDNMVPPYTYAWTLESGTSVTLPETKTNSSIAVTPVTTGSSVVRCTVTDSTAGTPLTAYAECTVTVSEVLSIEYIRTNISTVTGTKVLTSGTVTTIVDDSSSSKNVYFQDGNYAALAYKASSLDESIVIGSKVLVSGTVTVYKGMLELTSPTISYLDKGSEITPYEITTWSSDSLKDMDSRLVTIDLKYVSGSLSDGSKASNVSTLFGETSVIMRSATAIQAVAIYEAYDEFFSKVSTYGTFTFTGILGWFDAPQLAPADVLELSSNDVDAVDAVYSLLHMNETVEGQCTTLFGPAKTAVLALSSNQLNMFQNASYYADAKLRYEAWAVNQGEKPYELGLSVANGTIHSESLYIPAVIIVAIASLTALVAFVVIKKKKETNE